jgi:lipopolysaccharide biosynthesis glycosyltransferase
MNREIVIAFCADSNMEQPLHIAMSSVLRHLSPAVVPHFYLVPGDIGHRGIQKLRDTLDLTHKPFHLTVLANPEAGFYKGFYPLHGDLMSFTRLMLPEMIETDRILYLDADTVTTVDVSTLFSLDMSKHALGAVHQGTRETAGDGALYKQLGMQKDSPVFNSGVLLMNADAWRSESISDALMQLCASGIKNGDQTALNVFFEGKVLDIGQQYNVKLYPNQANSGVPDQGIYHFVGSPKPWDLFGDLLGASPAIYKQAREQTAVAGLSNTRWLRLRNYTRAYRIAGGYYRAIRSRLSN